jgi:hypothetical protein
MHHGVTEGDDCTIIKNQEGDCRGLFKNTVGIVAQFMMVARLTL